MKNSFLFSIASLIVLLSITACDKTGNYPGGSVSPYVGILDVRKVYKDGPVELNQEVLGGSSKLAVLVNSDHSGGNIPSDLVFVQDARRLGFLRGIALNIGAEAKNYVPGDSIIVDVEGARLDRVDGTLQITNLSASKISKVSSGLPVAYQRANAAQIILNPTNYESTLTVIVKGGFNPIPVEGAILSGDLMLNDGFGNLRLATDAQANFSQDRLFRMANYYGIVMNKSVGDSLVPYLKPRVRTDIVELKSEYKTPKIIIAGWHNDPAGTDANNEFIQFIATEDIDFSKTPYCVVTTNNANAATPTGFPAKGWATGDVRTYKINITSGKTEKGKFFYVGGTSKRIDATNSTVLSEANWVANYDYSTKAGYDFGTKTSGLLANSGNAYGVSIFAGTKVDVNSVPEDVLFVGTGGSLFGNGYGYRITNNDFYDIINPLNLAQQPFYRAGTNVNAMTYNTPSDAALYNSWGGEFNMTLGRWTKARVKNAIQLTDASVLSEIEHDKSTKLVY